MPENRIRKVDSSASSPSATLPFGGPQAAGIAYDAGRKGLILSPEDASSRRLIPETFFASFATEDGSAAANWPSIFFIAPYGVEVVAVKARYEDASSATLDIKKVPSGTAVSSGVSVLSSALDLSDAESEETTISGTLNATAANLKLAAGDALALAPSGTLDNLTNVAVVVELKRRPDVA